MDPATLEAVCDMAAKITVVSPERIAAEVQRMLVDRHRSRAVRLLLETGLASAILPEIVPPAAPQQRTDYTLEVLRRLNSPEFPLALAALLCPWVDGPGANATCRRWRLSNCDTDRVTWLVQHHAVLAGARSMRWSRLPPFLVADGGLDLLALEEASAAAASRDASHMAWCRLLLCLPPGVIDPPRLVGGDDLQANKIPPGPHYKALLQRLRDAQLDCEVSTKEAALAMARALL